MTPRPIRWSVLVAMLTLTLVVVAAAQTPPAAVSDLTAQRSGASVILTWTHADSGVYYYEVWWSDSPYGAPGNPGVVKVADVMPGALHATVTYTDTASGVGNSGVNSFYAVRGVNAGGEASALSNRVGEFDYGLNGTPVTRPVVDHCGTISTDQVWGPNKVHRVTCGVTVDTGAQLLLLPGTVVKFADTSSSLYVYSQLEAAGTAANPVVFTSLKDDVYGGDTNNDGSASTPASGDWNRIWVYGRADLDHTIVRYGGQCCAYGAIILENGSSLSFTNSRLSYSRWEGIDGRNPNSLTIINSTIEYSGNWGIGIDGIFSGAFLVNSSTIRNNGAGGIGFGGATSTSIAHSNIYGNSGYGVYNGNTTTVANAENNWWGSDSGPAPYGAGNGINYRTCYDSVKKVNYICQYYVDADPWVGQAYAVETGYGNAGPATSHQTFVADPVNTANGNYVHQHTDIAIATRGLALDFARTYNSLHPAAESLGFGWTHNWNLKLVENPTDNSVTVTFGDGHAERWTWTGATYDGGPGVFGLLVKNGDGAFDLIQKDQTRYHFAASGRLEWAEDKNANRTNLTYDGQNRLVTVAEPAGRTLTLAYTSPISATLISGVTDHTSRTVQYAYDADANLVTVTDVAGHNTTYTYDANHRLLTITDANGHTFVRNVYDASGRVSEQYDTLNNKTTFAYDEPAHKTLVTDPRNFVTTYQYDGDWRLTGETDPLNNTASHAYDADNNRIQVTDKRNSVTKYEYDDRGNTTVITDTLSFTRAFTYDVRNNLLTETDPRGYVTTYEYDAHSNLLKRTDPLNNVATWTYNGYGLVTTATDPRSHTTSYAYDAYGHPATVADPLGQTTTFVYDSRGRKSSETDARGHTRTFTYDAANRLLTTAEPLGKTTAYAYDAAGNRIAVTENGLRTTQYAYDAKDRLVLITDPLGHTTGYGYDAVNNQTAITNALGLATSYTYDALNRRVSVTDPLGHTTGYGYDAVGNRTQLTDANGKLTQYTYDALNRLTQVTDAAAGVVQYTYDASGSRVSLIDANNHTTAYAYDALNRLIGTTDPLSHMTDYGYDGAGNRTSQSKPDGTTITYAYDALNRLATIAYPGGSVSYGYDAVGNRTAMTDTTGVTAYTYDDLDRLTQVAGPIGTVGYGYDLFGDRTTLTYPGSQTVTYAYDLAGRLIDVTDHASRVTHYTYDAANRPTGIQFPNGVQAAYTYDNADRLLSLIHTSPVSGTIASATYTLDAMGNRLSMQDLDGTTSYVYDNLYRLTQVTYPGGEQVTYSYDPMGNRTAMISSVHGTTNYTYDAADRLLTAAATTFAWDANGRMTGKGAATYAYDALDRLTQVISGTATVGFAYNGGGVRLSKTVNGAMTAYVQDLQAPLPVVLTETTGGQTSLYLYGTDLLAQVGPTGNPSYYHVDGLGSTRALSNAAGQRTDTYSYDVFGTARSRTGGSGQPFTFTGEQGDGELGLVFLRARYYDPQSGRFVSRDPFSGHQAASQTLNRFVYVQNNPVRLIDPSGHNAILDLWDVLSKSKAVYEYGQRAMRDERVYGAWREFRSSHPDESPTRDDINMILQYNLDYDYQAHVRPLRDLGQATQEAFGDTVVNWLFPLKWRGPDNDAEYQEWYQTTWELKTDRELEKPGVGYRDDGNALDDSDGGSWGSPPSQGK